MSTCISSHGEFSSHFPGPERFICGYCGAQDWDAAMAEHDQLRTLLDLFIDPDNECRFDHHGGCQEHGFLDLQPGEICPNKVAKTLLGMP